MTWYIVDVETDGPIPGDYSMVSVGAVAIGNDGNLKEEFYGQLKPISDKWVPEALVVSGHSREQCLTEFDDPKVVMERFTQWIRSTTKGRPMFASDNNGFDWMFVCWYFHHFTDHNPFGFSSTNIGSLYKGLVGSVYENFKHLRRTKHSHHPVDDARGNAEALLHMKTEQGLKVKF